jgi:PTS system galactitol-specific IIA component
MKSCNLYKEHYCWAGLVSHLITLIVVNTNSKWLVVNKPNRDQSIPGSVNGILLHHPGKPWRRRRPGRGQPLVFIINEDLIIVGMVATDNETVIRKLGALLMQAGHVKVDFVDSVIARERVYPTGLASEIPVAIPHTDHLHCNSSALAIGLLKTPVRFGAAGESGHQVMARIVFLLSLIGLPEEAQQVILLSELISHPDALTKILDATSAREVALQMKNHFLLSGNEPCGIAFPNTFSKSNCV